MEDESKRITPTAEQPQEDEEKFFGVELSKEDFITAISERTTEAFSRLLQQGSQTLPTAVQTLKDLTRGIAANTKMTDLEMDEVSDWLYKCIQVLNAAVPIIDYGPGKEFWVEKYNK